MSGRKHTNWNFWAQSHSWFYQTQPPPTPPYSALLQTDSRSHRKASRRCCLYCHIRRQKQFLERKSGNVYSNWCKINFAHLSCSMQLPNQQMQHLQTSKKKKKHSKKKIYHFIGNVVQPECVPVLTNKERPGANTWRPLQVEQVKAVLLYCHVNHLNTEEVNCSQRFNRPF